jgi:EAL domain-containing protein (putative c-di-GMP-specific phosphodiesterase class I)
LLNTESEQQLLLEELRAYGIKLCIDDFGTGYSSLGRLHEFPISTIKIDRSFLNYLNTDKNDKIVRAIITLARELGMEVITEGIETFTQLNKLRDFTCEQGQGFLFSQPVDVQSATLMLLHPQPDKLFATQAFN